MDDLRRDSRYSHLVHHGQSTHVLESSSSGALENESELHPHRQKVITLQP